MEEINLGNQIIDIRDGSYHIVIDQEIFDDITLYYTNNNTSIPSTYVIGTDLLISSYLFLKEINNQPITEWLRKNNEVTLSIKVNPDFNAEETWNRIIKKHNKPKSFWVRLKIKFYELFK